MAKLPPTIVAFLAFCLATTASAQPIVTPTWVKVLKDGERLLGVEERGRCTVMAGGGAIHVLRPAGELWWSWPHAKISRFIEPGRVAVSPACDAIVIPGNPSYKYTWIVQRGGRAVAVKTLSVPADTAFDRSGQFVAIGTFSGTLYFYSLAGILRWKRDVQGAAIISGIQFSDDNRWMVSTGWGGVGIIGVDGNVSWANLANRLSASRDLGTFVFGNEPNHGPGYSSFTVTDADRKTLFFRFGGVETFLSATGHRILGAVDRPPDGIKDQFSYTDSGVQLLTRGGDIVTTYPEYDAPFALSDDGQRMWLRSKQRFDCVDDKGTVLATIAINVGQRAGDDDRPWSQTYVARGFEQLVVSTYYDGTTTVARYEVPAQCRQASR